MIPAAGAEPGGKVPSRLRLAPGPVPGADVLHLVLWMWLHSAQGAGDPSIGELESRRIGLGWS